MSDTTAIVVAREGGGLDPQDAGARAEQTAVDMWLYGLSKHTQRNYRREWIKFRSCVTLPLPQISLAELQGYCRRLDAQALTDGSRHFAISAVKSFFHFLASRVRVIPFDPAAALRMPSGKDTLTERILEEADVIRMLEAARSPRDRAILAVLYFGGVRREELAALKWRDLVPRDQGVQITVYGKGRKTRVIFLPAIAWKAVESIMPASTDRAELPLIPSAGVGAEHLSESQIYRIVRKLARAAGINKKVSPHWLRHCCASHSLDHGASLALIQSQLGHSNSATTMKYVHARQKESLGSYLPKPNW